MGMIKKKKITISKKDFIKEVSKKIRLQNQSEKNIIGYFYGQILDYARFYGGNEHIRKNIQKAVEYLRDLRRMKR
jgi:DNA-directed RNA polymerase delta subunit